jgi:signal transduction histidine kinase
MTLRRKLANQISAMILGLLLVSGLAVWGLVGLKQNFDAALAGYEELRRVYAVGSHVATARTLVSLSRHGEPPALVELRDALQLLDASPAPAGEDAGATAAGHRTRIRKGIVESIRELESRRASPAALNQPIAGSAFAAIEQAVTTLASDIRSDIERAQAAADARRRFTIVLVASVCAAVVIGAVLLGASQYRSVMRPLTDLSAAVRRIAAGDFSSKVPADGATEFAALAADFNRTAGELDTVYRGLEAKVEAKSKQLVRSERLASVGYLAAGVAHEINNPLGIIAGHAELSLQQLDRAKVGAGSPRPIPTSIDAPVTADLRHTLQTIADEAFRCKTIIDKLLSLARPGDDDRQVISLEAVARSVVSLLSALPEHRNRKLTLDVRPDTDTRILASENEMKQVLLNLAKNAVESLPEGAGAVTIALRHRAETVELSVTDTGRGMSPDILDHVFEPFFTTKRGAGSPGTGLGLSISHAIIESHGGALTVHSEGASRGATFTLTLPAATPPSSPENTDAKVSLAPVLGGEGRGRGSA